MQLRNKEKHHAEQTKTNKTIQSKNKTTKSISAMLFLIAPRLHAAVRRPSPSIPGYSASI